MLGQGLTQGYATGNSKVTARKGTEWHTKQLLVERPIVKK